MCLGPEGHRRNRPTMTSSTKYRDFLTITCPLVNGFRFIFSKKQTRASEKKDRKYFTAGDHSTVEVLLFTRHLYHRADFACACAVGLRLGAGGRSLSCSRIWRACIFYSERDVALLRLAVRRRHAYAMKGFPCIALYREEDLCLKANPSCHTGADDWRSSPHRASFEYKATYESFGFDSPQLTIALRPPLHAAPACRQRQRTLHHFPLAVECGTETRCFLKMQPPKQILRVLTSFADRSFFVHTLEEA